MRIPTREEFEREEKASGYKAYGGDRFLNSQHYDWFFSMNRFDRPDESVDGNPWTLVDKQEFKIVIRSNVSKYLGVQCTRTIELSRNTPQVFIRMEIKQIRPTVFPVMAWTLSMVKIPRFVLLDAPRSYPAFGRNWSDMRRGTSGEAVSPSPAGTVLFKPWNFEPKPKIGTMGVWLAAVYDRTAFIQQTEFFPQRCYPDGASLEVFTDGRIYEIETLSPSAHLQPGQSLTHQMTWTLLALPEESEQQIIDRIIASIKQEKQ